MAGRGLCGQAQAGLCRGLPLQAGTHSKNPQCLVDSQAQAQAQGSRRGDTVVAATERRVPCAALQAAVQSHTAPGLLVQPPGPASKHTPGALGRSVCRCFSGVSSVQGPADVPRGLLPPQPHALVETRCCSLALITQWVLPHILHPASVLMTATQLPPHSFCSRWAQIPGLLTALGYFVSKPAPLPSNFSDPSFPPSGGENG